MTIEEEATLGPTLRRLRQEAGLTIRELDHRTGISPRQIENLEAGRAANPRRRTLQALASELGSEVIAAAFEDFVTLSGRSSRRRATASKLGWPGWPTLDDTPALALAGR